MEPTFSSRVLTKGQALLDAGNVYATGAHGLYTVIGQSGSGYAVQVDPAGGFATCSCAHGRHHPAASCSHVAAVLLAIRESAEESRPTTG